MKKYLLILLALFPVFSQSQTKFNFLDKFAVVNYTNIDTANVETKEMVNVWTSYLKSRLYGWLKKNDTLGAGYWNNEERKLTTFPDQMCFLYPWLYYFPTTILNIEPCGDGFFRILNSNTEADSNGIIDTKAIYYVLIKKINNEYKLFNYFYHEKDQLNAFTMGMIRFYYPQSYHFSDLKARKLIRFQDSLSRLFDLPLHEKLDYVVDSDNASLIRHFGCIYLKTFYTNKSGQYWKENHTLLSSFDENDQHEMVHYFTSARFTDYIHFFDEGIATYLGGSLGHDLSWHIAKLNNYFNRAGADTANIMNHPRIGRETQPFYVTGGIIMKYAVDNYGFQKALKLLSYSEEHHTPEEVIEKELGIPKAELNAFFLKYITKHKLDKN